MIAIYLVTCSVTNKSYVGITKLPLSKRWGRHVWSAQHTSAKGLPAAIRKYGHDSFSTKLLDLAQTRKEAEQIEREMIARHRTLSPNGYNLTHGGDAAPISTGRRHSAETKAKMRTAALGKPKSATAVANMRRALTGRKLSPQHAAKLKGGRKNQGKKHLPDQTLAHRIMLYERSLVYNKGVTFPAGARSKKWRAQITIDGRKKHLGNFDTRAAAEIVYRRAVQEILLQLRRH